LEVHPEVCSEVHSEFHSKVPPEPKQRNNYHSNYENLYTVFQSKKPLHSENVFWYRGFIFTCFSKETPYLLM
jgi:hypothetical protein